MSATATYGSHHGGGSEYRPKRISENSPNAMSKYGIVISPAKAARSPRIPTNVCRTFMARIIRGARIPAMRAVIQRVSRASVTVDGEGVGKIDRGLLVLLGVTHADTEASADYLAEKITGLRIFEDDAGKMNLSVTDVGGAILAVSQFTLYGDVRKGKRPSFDDAARPEEARKLYEYFVERIRGLGLRCEAGRFQEMMQVELVNDGPVTILLDSEKTF